jgi:uncharacterized membrane protein YfcA
MFGGTLAVSLANFQLRHHLYDRPLINYNVAAIIEPVSWLGSILGVMINRVIPDWLLYVTQFFVYCYTAYITLMKGIAEWKRIHHEKLDDEMRRRLSETEIQSISPNSSMESIGEEPLQPPKAAFSWTVIVIFGILWLIFVIIPFLRGGARSTSIIGVEFCSPWYWILTFLPFPIAAGVSAITIQIARRYPVIGAHADLSCKQIIYLVVWGVIAGVASGFLGIGGGIIKEPLLLYLGVEAREMTATSSFMIVMTTSINSIQFMVRGTLAYSEFRHIHCIRVRVVPHKSQPA